MRGNRKEDREEAEIRNREKRWKRRQREETERNSGEIYSSSLWDDDMLKKFAVF